MKQLERIASRLIQRVFALARVAALGTLGVVLAGGCGEVTSSSISGGGGEADVFSLVLSIGAGSTSVAPGGTVQLSVSASNASGTAAPDGTIVTVFQTPALGTISPSSTATVAGKAEFTFTAGTTAGQVSFAATSGSVSAQCSVTIDASGGGGGGGGGVSDDEISVAEVTWLHPSPADFRVTATLSNIQINYPEISWTWTQPGWPVEYDNGVLGNNWVFASINGRWYAATWEWLRASTSRVNLEAKDGEPPFIQASASPISEWYPQSGEEIGFMVSTPCRSGISSTSPRERSPIIKTRWP